MMVIEKGTPGWAGAQACYNIEFFKGVGLILKSGPIYPEGASIFSNILTINGNFSYFSKF